MTVINHGPSSSGLISGLPYAAGQLLAMDSIEIVGAVVDRVLKDGNSSLKKDMLESDLWKPFADKVKIRWDGEQFSYDLLGTPEENAYMRSLEYGTPGLPPSPMLRKHAFHLGDTTSQGVAAVTKEVVGLGE